LMGIGRELPVNQIKPSKLGSVTRGSPALVIETAVLASLHAAPPRRPIPPSVRIFQNSSLSMGKTIRPGVFPRSASP